MSNAVLLIAHGSRRAAANEDLVRLADQLRQRQVAPIIEVAYLELVEPHIAAGAANCVAAGATTVRMLPYFLSAGEHVVTDLQRLQRELATAHPGVSFEVCPPLGVHPLMVDIVLDRLREVEGERPGFAALVASRRGWIDRELQPWCQQAPVSQLRLAELEWPDIAGKVTPEATLWPWAWSRFPDLVHGELNQIDETREVLVTLRDGRQFRGFPDARQSEKGSLVLLGRPEGSPRQFSDQGPFLLDEIRSVTV